VVKIVIAPNPVLSNISKPISRVTPSIIKIIEEMKKTLDKTTDPKGVGLAAPQVGKSLRIFIAKPTDNSKISIFINPEILENSQKINIMKSKENDSKKLEGCLSLPSIWGPVDRSSWIILSYMDELGNQHKQKFSGFLATIIQHETDHLNGILFPKRVLDQKGTLYKSHKNKKNEDEFEEIEI
jgi:peptide deformylase